MSLAEWTTGPTAPCQRDVRFMTMLAELIVYELDEQRRQERLRGDLMKLIEETGIKIALQPIIDVRRECLGLEALSRLPQAIGARLIRPSPRPMPWASDSSLRSWR